MYIAWPFIGIFFFFFLWFLSNYLTKTRPLHGDNLPAEARSVFAHCQKILSPYMNNRATEEILLKANDEIKSEYDIYKNIKDIPDFEKRKYDYSRYIDLFVPHRDKFYREESWAICYVLSQLYHCSAPLLYRRYHVDSVLEEAFKDLEKRLETKLRNRMYDEDICPEAFLNLFTTSWGQNKFLEEKYKAAKEEREREDKDRQNAGSHNEEPVDGDGSTND